MTDITTIAALEALYDGPLTPATVVKDSSVITAHYRALIEASPFVALATVGPEGLDCSPRGDRGAVVTVLDPKTLALPDRRGNNRIESLRNIVRDPAGKEETLGTAGMLQFIGGVLAYGVIIGTIDESVGGAADEDQFCIRPA